MALAERNHVASILIAVLLGAVCGSFVTYALMQRSIKLRNSATLKAIGVGIYADENCTASLASISWGVIGPADTKNFTCYLRSESNAPIALSMTISDWQPQNISSWIIVSWNLEGLVLTPQTVVQATFTLTVNNTIPLGFSDFTFIITITGSG